MRGDWRNVRRTFQHLNRSDNLQYHSWVSISDCAGMPRWSTRQHRREFFTRSFVRLYFAGGYWASHDRTRTSYRSVWRQHSRGYRYCFRDSSRNHQPSFPGPAGSFRVGHWRGDAWKHRVLRNSRAHVACWAQFLRNVKCADRSGKRDANALSWQYHSRPPVYRSESPARASFILSSWWTTGTDLWSIQLQCIFAQCCRRRTRDRVNGVLRAAGAALDFLRNQSRSYQDRAKYRILHLPGEMRSWSNTNSLRWCASAIAECARPALRAHRSGCL